MKHKISELESRGINPSRDNVQPHLNNIRKFTHSKLPSISFLSDFNFIFPLQTPINSNPEEDQKGHPLNLTIASYQSLLRKYKPSCHLHRQMLEIHH